MIVFNIKKCTKCKIEKTILDFRYLHSGKFQVAAECKKCLMEYQKTYRKNNKEKMSEQQKKRYIKNKNKILDSRRKWYQKNKSKNNEYHKEYIKAKRQTDVLFRIKCSFRARLYHFINKKNKNTLEYLGLSLDEYKIYLSKMFDNNMNWNNYGEWHIDHIIPLSSAKNEEELIRLFHYTNTQPLWAKDNLKKSNKI